MNKNSLLLRIIRACLIVFLCSAAGSAFATATFGIRLDNWCAIQPIQPAAPQQSRPYQASGSSCFMCHGSGGPTSNNLNALGTASLSCTGSGTSTTCGAAVNQYCVATAPSNATIINPPVGTSVVQGQPLTFTAGTATNPDGFPLSYTWLFSAGQLNSTGQSISVQMSVAGQITTTLQVRNSVGMLATGTPPTRTVNVITAANRPPVATINAPTGNVSIAQGGAVTFQGSGTDPDNNLPLSYSWNFGGGAPNSTAQNPGAVTFNTAGVFTVTFIVTDSLGLVSSPVTRTVTVTATTLPTLTVSPANVTFTAQAGGTAPGAQSLLVTSSGAQVNLSATASTASGGNWLTVAPASSATPSTLTITVNQAGLAAGTYSGTVTITSSGVSNSPRTVTVTLTVTAAALPALTVAPANLTFTAQAGGTAPAAQSLSVTSSGAQVNLSATASTVSGGNWLSVAPASSTTPSTLNVSVNPAGLAAGTYSGTVTITGAASNSPRTVAVTLTVTATALPALTVSPASLTFAVQAGGTSPAAQSLSVTSSGAQVSLSATASTVSGGNWLTVAPASSTTPSTLNVSVNPAGLAAGTYSGTVTIASGGVSNSPRTVAVTLTVTAGGVLPVAIIVAPAINVSVLPGGRVTFKGAATDPANLPLTYRWSFNGGEPSRSTRQNPGTVRFKKAGTFTVTLTVTNSQRVASLPVTRIITVAAPNRSPRVDDKECLKHEEHEDDRNDHGTDD